MKTKITELFNIKYPIVGGAMMNISTPNFVASISNAGGLGVYPSAMVNTKVDLVKTVKYIKALTSNPFAVNLNFFPAMKKIDNYSYLEALIENDIRIIETSGSMAPPPDLINLLKEAGIKWIHKCVTVRHALKVQELGADALAIMGYEGAGHMGKDCVGSIVIIPKVVRSVKIPVVAAGGIVDGRGLLAMLSFGAEGILLGTRLLLTKEAPINERLKEAMLNSNETDTIITMKSINNACRSWANQPAISCANLDSINDAKVKILEIANGENTRRLIKTGEVAAGLISCGQAIGLIDNIPTVSGLFNGIVNEYNGLINKFKYLSGPS